MLSNFPSKALVIIESQSDRWISIALAASAIYFITMYVAVAIWHLAYPYEIEWYEGLTLDHVVRVVQGLPIYAKPSIYFSATLYQPLYFYLVAPVFKIFGSSFFSGRIVTVAASFLGATIAGRAVYRLCTGSKQAVIVVLGLFFATYALTDYVQTLVRIDATYVCFLLLAFYAVSRATWTGSILSVLFFVAAFFTKQEAVFFMPLPILWLFLHNRRMAIFSIITLCVVIVLGTWWLNASSLHWYTYYVYGMPRAKARYYGYARVFIALPAEVFRYWGVALLIISGVLVSLGKRFKVRSEAGLWLLALISSILQFCAHRGDQMAGNNVLYPLCAIAPVFLTYAVWQAREVGQTMARLYQWGLLMQLVSFVYVPQHLPMIFPGKEERASAEKFFAFVRTIHGDVVIPAHGFLSSMAGKNTHTHCQVEDDVIVMHDQVAADYMAEWKAAFQQQKFGAIIWDKSTAHEPDSIPGYNLIHSLPLDWRIGSKMGNEIIRPTYLYWPIGKPPPNLGM